MKNAFNMKGDVSTKIYSKQGSKNADKIIMNHEPTGPSNVWRNKLTGTEMKLPVGVSGGKHWEKVK